MRGDERDLFGSTDLTGSEALDKSPCLNCRPNSPARMRFGSVCFDHVVARNTHPELGI